MQIEVQKRGSKLFVNLSQIIKDEKDPTEGTLLQGKVLFDVAGAGKIDVLQKQAASFPSLVLSREDAAALGRILIAESK